MSNNKNTRYTISRDRMNDLRNGSSDSTDVFGPTRVPERIQQHQQRSSYELQERKPQQTIEPVAQTDISTMEGFLAEVDAISTSIKTIQQNIDSINEVHNTSLVSINEKQWQENSQRLAQYVDETSSMNQHVKNRIKTLELSNARQPKKTDLNIRKAQVGRIKKEFITCIQRYKDVEATFNQKYRQRVERQIRIVKQDVTEEELDAIIDSDQPNQIFAQSLLRSSQAKAVLSEVQTRHDDIKRIQKTILELAQLFEDMQMMVEEQGEVLDQIENNAENTRADLEQGVKHVNKAIMLARSTRAKKWCCFVFTLILCVVIAILVWWFAFDHPGVGDNNNNSKQ
ncbi:MAG: t-SNARE [Benjaminiella poitrasii]|nr:MAG: t-SNARE [Benjaminiella poitrasii]